MRNEIERRDRRRDGVLESRRLLAVLEDDDRMCEPDRFLEAIADQNDRNASGADLADERIDVFLGADVQAAGGMVE